MPAARVLFNEEPERALAGLRIVLTRPHQQAGDFEEAVRSLGGRPRVAPAIAIASPASWSAVDDALDRIAEFDWIAFTSANAVSALTQRARTRGIPAKSLAAVKLAAVGHVTAAVLSKELRTADVIAQSASAQRLGEEVPLTMGARVLVPAGDLAGQALVNALRRRGAEPTAVEVYRTVPGDGIPSIIAGWSEMTIDALLFASGSAVRFVADALASAMGDRPTNTVHPAIFCIGPTTARVAESVGLIPDGIAAEATQRALIDEVTRWFAARRSGGG